jgi:peptidoglycan DL-endopeptidase CwlO
VRLLLAVVLALAAPPQLVTVGYPYAARCPAAGAHDVVDRWRMDMCNCTSYVAWALARNGYRTDWFEAGEMDARRWSVVARREGIPVGFEPRRGAVAVWPWWKRFGHVAFVTQVHPDGTFDVAEYNTPGGVRYGFDTRQGVSRRGVVFVYVPRR